VHQAPNGFFFGSTFLFDRSKRKVDKRISELTSEYQCSFAQ
jgi:hypothetical protein